MTVGLLEPDDFRNAITIMKKYGWCQGIPKAPGGPVCAARALNIAVARRTGGHWAAAHEARKWLGLYGMTVPQWNDSYSTTFEDVVARFTRAADRFEQALSEREGCRV